jgi:N-acetylmuramoyl-L-alanine amidase
MRVPFSYWMIGLFLLGTSIFYTDLQASNNKFKVVIDPGHGGKDAGAIGSVLKVKEKDINLEVALELGRLLEKEKDVEVIYTRKTDIFVALDERPRIANKAKADLFISIHTNAAANKAAFGTETYVVGASGSKANMEVAMRENSVILYEEDYKTRYEGFDPNSSESYIMFEFMQFAFMDQSLNLAACVQEQFTNICKRSDRGVKQAGFWVLKQSSMPSILVELGYISNAEEEKYLSLSKSRKVLAEAVYKAFLTYKANYEKKNSVVFEIQENQHEKPVQELPDNGVVYRVQFCSSSKSLPLNNKDFKKCVPAKEYFENGLYKYTYGNETNYQEIVKVKNEVQKEFKDAFIVVFEDGKKLSPAEAKEYYK